MPDEPSARHSKETKSSPPNRKSAGGAVFVAVFLSFTIIIATIVLLANDHRNLRLIMAELGLQWIIEAPIRPEVPPAPLKGKPVKVETFNMPENIMASVDRDGVSGFTREMPRIGPELCRAYNDAGFPNSGWHGSPVNDDSYECTSELSFDKGEDEESHGSLFFIAKGNQDGSINSLRMKLVAPESVDGRAAHAAILKALELLIECTGWKDLKDLLAAARRLKDYSADYTGLSIRFTQEFTSSDRFNLFILPSNDDPAISRTRNYFEAQKALYDVDSARPDLQNFAPTGKR